MPKLPGRKPFYTTHDLDLDWLVSRFRVYEPGDPQYRCYFCAGLFNTYEVPHGGQIERDSNPNEAAEACGACLNKLKLMADAEQVSYDVPLD